ncbi:MAG: hypothetical protein JO209_07285 [Acidisphaera sp.]|nr:hypothetical protein [Acidisphaera sp.]
MLALVPGRLLRRAEDAPNTLILEPDADGFIARWRGKRREEPLGRFMADADGARALKTVLARRGRPSACVLRPLRPMLLERAVTLPLAAERDPERVLGYEMDRLTPFAADQVFWTWSIIERDRVRNRLQLRLSLVPKAELAGAIALLEQVGQAPTAVEARSPEGAPRIIRLHRAPTRSQQWQRRSVMVLGGACAVLAVVAAILPFLLQSLARQRVEAEIAALRPAVQQAEALRRQIAARAADTDVVAAESARTGDPLAVLAAVTEILPDDTYLTELTLSQRRLGLNGQSAAAARLIAALAADPSIRNPAFSAPVTHSDIGHGDLFAISAEIAP